MSATAKDLQFYERNWFHWEERRPRPPILNNNLNAHFKLTILCSECHQPTKYEKDQDEMVCTHCGLVLSSSHRYVGHHRIYYPLIDDRPEEPPFNRVEWWRNFLITYKPFIYPDDKRWVKILTA